VKAADRCPKCQGPMPPRPRTGRPPIYCSVGCRDAAAASREAERNRLARERYDVEQQAVRKARDEEAARRHEREYQRAIAAGGAVAANARWERVYDETYDKYGGWYGLCQWEDEDDSGEFTGRLCTRRTRDVYCWRHNRQLERETERRRGEQASTVIPRPNERKE
jgi:hypothetical protein